MKLLALIVGVLLVGGCSVPVPDALRPAGTTASSTPAPPAVVEPWAISIPKIGARSTLDPLGLTIDGQLEIPPVDSPEVAGWYAGPDKAELGDECPPSTVACSAVVVGHVDGLGPDGRKGFPGVFARLHELAAGDMVLVERADGGTLRYVVERVESVAKDELPSDIYTLADQPRLNLVTCDSQGGFGNDRAGHYDRNVIVRAVLAE